MNDLDIIRIGRDAEQVLASEAFQMAMKGLDAGLVELWAQGQFVTPQEREEAFGRVRGARMFREKLMELINGMKLAKDRAEQRAKRQRAAGQAEE